MDKGQAERLLAGDYAGKAPSSMPGKPALPQRQARHLAA